MTITTHHEGPVTVLELQGKIMHENDTAEFMEVVKEMLLENRHRFVLDFSGVDWINSTGLGMLIAADGLVREVGGKLSFARLNDSVYQIINISRLNLVFDIHPSLDEAIHSLA